MTAIQCDQQYCKFNKHEICMKKHITLCNIKDVSQHFWFACFDYSGDQPPNTALHADSEGRCSCRIVVPKNKTGTIDRTGCPVHRCR